MIGLELATRIRDISIRTATRLAAEFALGQGHHHCGHPVRIRPGRGRHADPRWTKVLTPDSPAASGRQESYAEVGTNPPSYDKQFVRDWLGAGAGGRRALGARPPRAARAAAR